MKKYVETQGKAPFDWNAFLVKFEYTKEELTEGLTLARSWVTCACGNLCDIIPREQEGAPEDMYLASLGQKFFERICDLRTYLRVDWNGDIRDDYEFTKVYELQAKARITLIKIEQRSTELINRIQNARTNP